jgi:hypothetical protein
MPWHDMYVQVGDALADAIIDGDKRTLRAQRLLDGAFEFLHDLKERANLRDGQIRQRFNMLRGNQQHVSEEQRTMVEEGHGGFISPDDFRRDFARHDVAENAAHGLSR